MNNLMMKSRKEEPVSKTLFFRELAVAERPVEWSGSPAGRNDADEHNTSDTGTSTEGRSIHRIVPILAQVRTCCPLGGHEEQD